MRGLCGSPFPAGAILPPGLGQNAGNLGQYLPAVDVTPLSIATGAYKGVTCAPTIATSGPFAGDAIRCLGDSSSAVAGTVGAEWSPDRDTLVYGRYNRGYKALGFNAGYISANPEAAPEFVDDFEVGLKKTFGRTFQLNIDGFYIDYQNDQVSIETAIGSGGGALTEFINVPRAVSRGVELNAVWSPIDRLNLSLMYAFDDTQVLSDCHVVGGTPTGFCVANGVDPFAVAQGAKPVDPLGNPGIQSVKGNPLPQTPRNKIALNANYTWRFEPGDLTLSASYIWKDASHYTIFTSSEVDYAPSWDQVDMRAIWSGDHGRYAVILYVKNLFDTLGYAAAAGGSFVASAAGSGRPAFAQSYDLTPPRQFGGELRYKF